MNEMNDEPRQAYLFQRRLYCEECAPAYFRERPAPRLWHDKWNKPEPPTCADCGARLAYWEGGTE